MLVLEQHDPNSPDYRLNLDLPMRPSTGPAAQPHIRRLSHPLPPRPSRDPPPTVDPRTRPLSLSIKGFGQSPPQLVPAKRLRESPPPTLAIRSPPKPVARAVEPEPSAKPPASAVTTEEVPLATFKPASSSPIVPLTPTEPVAPPARERTPPKVHSPSPPHPTPTAPQPTRLLVSNIPVENTAFGLESKLNRAIVKVLDGREDLRGGPTEVTTDRKSVV